MPTTTTYQSDFLILTQFTSSINYHNGQFSGADYKLWVPSSGPLPTRLINIEGVYNFDGTFCSSFEDANEFLTNLVESKLECLIYIAEDGLFEHHIEIIVPEWSETLSLTTLIIKQV